MSQVIVYPNDSGTVTVCFINPAWFAEEGNTMQVAVQKAVPAGLPHAVIDPAALPVDDRFRDAWELQGEAVTENFAKAKVIAHQWRRANRTAQFTPLDEAIAKQIPGTDLAGLEAQRQAIRDENARWQLDIDATTAVDELRSLLQKLESL